MNSATPWTVWVSLVLLGTTGELYDHLTPCVIGPDETRKPTRYLSGCEITLSINNWPAAALVSGMRRSNNDDLHEARI